MRPARSVLWASSVLGAFLVSGGRAATEEAKPPIPAVESSIDRVLLYSDRALVIRVGKISVPAGRSRVAFEGLPGKLYDFSVAAALTGPVAAKIANIEVEPVYKTTFRTKEAEEASQDLKSLEREMRVLQDQRAAVLGEADFAKAIRIGARPPAAIEPKPLPLAPDSWAAVLDFLGQGFREAALRERELAEKMDDLRAKIVVASARARMLLSYKNELTKRVILEIAAEKPADCGVEVSYIIPDAAWFPRYDVRADLNAGRIEITSYGLVRQESGEDWSDAQLSFSAAEPSMAASLPVLTSWRIAAAEPPAAAPGYRGGGKTGTAVISGPQAALAPAETPAPMQAPSYRGRLLGEADKKAADLRANLDQAQIIFKMPGKPPEASAGGLSGLEGEQSKRAAGQVAQIEQLYQGQQDARARKDWQVFFDANGKIIAAIQKLQPDQQKQLAEFQSEAYENVDIAQRWLESEKLEHGLIAPVASSGGYDYRWQALRRESVPSDGALTKAVLLRREFPASFVYEIAPRKSKLAFLRTKLTNSTRSPFLAGPASVFLGPDFVGESSLATCAPTEEFTVGLGADEEIAVERRVETKRDTRGFISSDYRFNVEVSIAVRNGKARPVSAAVLERLPVTWDSKLTISDGEFAPKPTKKEEHQDRTTFVRWEMTLAPGEKQDITMKYWYQHGADLRAVATEDPSVKW